MASSISSLKFARSKKGASTALGVATILLIGGSPETAAYPDILSAGVIDEIVSEGSESTLGKSKKAEVEAFNRQVDAATQFMRTAADESTYFDMSAARAAGADAATLEMGAIINRLAAGQKSVSDGQMSTNGLSLPLWGNWCGPGHGGGSAVDVLDSICRTHDKCYGSRGYFACSCDRAIVKDIQRNITRMGKAERTVAAAVSTYFTYCLCNPFT
ncbi:hypothetical protein E8P82_08480 [Arthrobacter echini]|uniref:Phospholipase A2 domain-containing protein n=1 Tax=Arthrobacter echini TaxID=1529066 RepID=A0A4S5E4R7_9MICC|nr:hypothetical protein [Arthrobacter echini]THJ66485.1 hypothetical protein E8P82_08480 [Arthrobacter echini]